MKIVTIIFRTLLGLFLLFASLSYFFKFGEQPAPTGDMKIFNDGLMASKYMMPFVKTLELLCGLAFVTNKFTRLASIVLLPISINIMLINIYLAPAAIPFGAFLLLGNIFMIYKHWDAYKDIMKS